MKTIGRYPTSGSPTASPPRSAGPRRTTRSCLAHLIREATYAVAASDSAALRKLLKRACGVARRRPDLADATLRTYAPSQFDQEMRDGGAG